MVPRSLDPEAVDLIFGRGDIITYLRMVYMMGQAKATSRQDAPSQDRKDPMASPERSLALLEKRTSDGRSRRVSVREILHSSPAQRSLCKLKREDRKN